MNPDIFFENFELLADAPNGVQKLRELILQLAVMGKLVPQDPNDEPASMLRRKNDKSLKPVQENEIPFDYPKDWIFTRIDQVSNAIHYGYTASANNSLKNVRLLRITDIQNNSVNWETVPGCEIDNQKLNSYALKDNDLLIARTGGTIGKSYLVENLTVKAVFASYLIRIVPNNLIFPKYLKLYADSPLYWDQLYSKCSGTGQPNVNATSLKSLILPLPPLAEQKRIVSKVDELMSLCDKLETRRQKKQEIQSKLNSAALDRMLSAENQDEFEQRWQYICENFDLLYDNPENVEKLRQAILQLAVQGKLVPQNPEDEPASVLIDKIKAKKRQLVKAGKIKNSKVSAQIDSQEIPYELPDKWEWIRIEDITDIGTGSTPLKSKSEYYEDGSIPWITSSLTSLNYIDKAETYITETAVNECNLRIYPSGTLLVALYGQGKTRGQVSELRIEATINQACASIVFIENFENIKQYVKVLFEQKYEELRALAAGGAQPNLNVGKIKETLIPLPPLAEQKRIVEKVEQLMGLCDELQTKLRKKQEDSEKLMEAVVKGLLEGTATEKTELEEPIPLQVATIKLE